MIAMLAPLVPLFPLLACLLVFLFGPTVFRGRSHLPVAIGVGLSCLCSWALLIQVANDPGPHRIPIYEWMQIGDPAGVGAARDYLVSIPITLQVDSLSATMLSMLTFVATLVVIYAAGYMHGDPGYSRFFSVVALFVFSMIMLVLSANFVQLFVFWEAVGLCSYLLIGFWYEKPEAAAAGKKAFLVNRIGDFGFATGIFLLWDSFKSVDFANVLNPDLIMHQDPAQIGLACLCLITGAMGKSAQFPLHVWLPDAMEGPTPVSALIHAATMVTAGVYMITRCTPLFSTVPDVQVVVAFMGGFTAILAALIALTQNDLKRVLAYSTVSQLGYMFLGLGTGTFLGIAGGMLHLVTHAFFKALLFLGAGSVMHAMGGVIDMRHFSGLRKVMPHTHATFLIGSLALAGFPLLSGFWSKDAILSAAFERAYPTAIAHADAHGAGAGDHGSGSHAKTEAHGKSDGATKTEGEHATTPVAAVHAGEPRVELRLLGLSAQSTFVVLFWMASLTALLTAFYTFRAFFMTFYGPERIPPEAGHHAHESPPSMTVPLWILSVGAVLLGGVIGHPTGIFDRYLGLTIAHHGAEHHGTNWFVVGLSTVVALLGIAGAYVMYGKPSGLPALMGKLFGPFTRATQHRFYIDEAYQWLFVLPLQACGQISRFIDWFLIDTVLVGGTSRIASLLGRGARPLQNGLVQFYALSMLLAMAILLVALVWKQT